MAGIYETTQVGKREDLGDEIYNVDADATPFTSLIKTGERLKQMAFSYPAEVLPDRAFEGTLDGTDVSAYNSVTRYIIEAVAQLFRETWQVTNLANATDAAGVGRNEKGHQKALAVTNLKIMMERRFLSNEECAVESSPTPFATRGALLWIDDSAQGTKPVNAVLRPHSSTQGASSTLTEAEFIAMLVAAYRDRKGNRLDLDGFVGTSLKTTFDNWSVLIPVSSNMPVRQLTGPISAKEIVNQVDTLRTTVGTVRLHVSPNIAYTAATGAESSYTPYSGLFVDLKMWRKRFLIPMSNRELPDLGGGPRGLIEAACGLACLNPKGSVRIYATS